MNTIKNEDSYSSTSYVNTSESVNYKRHTVLSVTINACFLLLKTVTFNRQCFLSLIHTPAEKNLNFGSLFCALSQTCYEYIQLCVLLAWFPPAHYPPEFIQTPCAVIFRLLCCSLFRWAMLSGPFAGYCLFTNVSCSPPPPSIPLIPPPTPFLLLRCSDVKPLKLVFCRWLNSEQSWHHAHYGVDGEILYRAVEEWLIHLSAFTPVAIRLLFLLLNCTLHLQEEGSSKLDE